MKTTVYARVSTNNGQDPEMQLRELREYCERRGWEISREYVDAGISGTKEKRPQLDKLFADAHHRHFDAIVVWRFDRFAHSARRKESMAECCEFRAFNPGESGVYKVGRITLENGKLKGSWTKERNGNGNKATIQGILKEFSWEEDHEEIYPEKNPEAWFRSRSPLQISWDIFLG